MAKALGIGGVFFKSEDPAKLAEWYAKWLGLEIDSSYGGTSFFPRNLPAGSYSVWAPFKKDTKYFEPSNNQYMINLIVDDLAGVLRSVREGGAAVHGEPEELDYGKFGWFTDPEGNKVELWQPSPEE